MQNNFKILITDNNSRCGFTPYQWCCDHIGQPFRNWHFIKYSNGIMYIFKSKDDFLQFVLVWA